MSVSLPTVGAVVTSTNSFSRGYLAYLASVDAWSKWVDQIVIVDGGTTDESYTVLKQWITTSNWEVFHSPETLWGSHDRWHAAQWSINTNIGLRQLDTDWAFVICADYVLDLSTTGPIRQELADNQDAYVVTYERFKLTEDGRPYLTLLRGTALNLKKIRVDGIRIGYGISRERYTSDYPIYLQKQAQFIDPVNGVVKAAFCGGWVPVAKNLKIACVVYGHYFFSLEQVLTKLTEYNRIYDVRYSKRALKSRRMFITEQGLDRGSRILPKKVELNKPHPPEIKRVIDQFYYPAMLGNASRPATSRPLLIRLHNKVRNTLFQFSSFPSVRDAHMRGRVGDQSTPPLHLKDLYQKQDRYLPPEARIKRELSGI